MREERPNIDVALRHASFFLASIVDDRHQPIAVLPDVEDDISIQIVRILENLPRFNEVSPPCRACDLVPGPNRSSRIRIVLLSFREVLPRGNVHSSLPWSSHARSSFKLSLLCKMQSNEGKIAILQSFCRATGLLPTWKLKDNSESTPICAELIPGLPPMPHRQNHDFLTVIAIEDNISTTSKIDHPFAKLLRQFFNRAPHLRKLAQHLHSITNGLDRAPCRLAALRNKKVMQSNNVSQALRSPSQAWHSGA